MKKIRIDLDLILPEIPDERDACVQRLISSMEHHKGIEKTHLIPEAEGKQAQLCFHYDPDLISLERIEELAKKAGAEITKHYSHVLVEVDSIREMMEANVVENQLRKVPGISDVSVSATGNIRIEFEQSKTDKQKIEDAIGKEGLRITGIEQLDQKEEEEHEEHEGHEHDHGKEAAGWKVYLAVIVSLTMLIAGIILDYLIKPSFFAGWIRLAWYGLAYLPVGWPVASKGFKLLLKGDIFTEFILMTIATLGAFYIGEYPEGVAVMLFYNVGELFQDSAVNKAKRNIKALLNLRPDTATVLRNGTYQEVLPAEVEIGDSIQVKVGEKIPIDGELLTEGASFNTAALTGESKPSYFKKGDIVLAGMINQEKVMELKATKLFKDSSISRILKLVQEATTRKAKTEQFIRKFARVYTPVVVFLAIGLTFIPYLFVENYVFNQWLYRALIFLVISCPCALVISIPLGYFGGIGAGSRNGILFKGSNYLDLMTKVNTVVMDKTGTLTKGVFKVQEVKSYGIQENEWLPLVAALESQSTHPIAKAVVEYVGEATKSTSITDMEEISGHGLKGRVNGKQVLAGNVKLMENFNIAINNDLKNIADTVVVAALENKLVGYITIADEIKDDSKEAIEELHKRRIRCIMLSGDKQTVVDKVAKQLNIDEAYGDLLPEDKVKKVEDIKKDKSRIVAFAGDGINDAPVLALSDVGIAMGALGSDAAIETADVVIQTDQPSKISQAINIGRATNKIVWQNIALAFGVKIIVLALGAGGIATMWEAVFADVGVALLAILNAVRIQKMKF